MLFNSCGEIDDKYMYGDTQKINWTSAADSTTNALIDQFWNADGNYFNYGSNNSDQGFQYWPNAHAMDVVIDAYIRTKDDKYKAYFDKWFEGVKAQNGGTCHNTYYDDMEWNALTFLRLYQQTNDQKYLDAVEDLWKDISGGWNDTYGGGGIAWNKNQLYSKNSCSNGPACILAARLYEVTKTDSLKNWAVKIYDWEKDVLYDHASGAVYDNINGQTNVLDQTALTYNEGTFLGSALELYSITNDASYLNDAVKTANYTITNLIDTSCNILRDEGTGDNALFKGIFMRYYYTLLQNKDLSEVYKIKFENFFVNNATFLWTSGCYHQYLLFGSSWSTPPVGETQLTAQASACMMMEAMASYSNK